MTLIICLIAGFSATVLGFFFFELFRALFRALSRSARDYYIRPR